MKILIDGKEFIKTTGDEVGHVIRYIDQSGIVSQRRSITLTLGDTNSQHYLSIASDYSILLAGNIDVVQQNHIESKFFGRLVDVTLYFQKNSGSVHIDSMFYHFKLPKTIKYGVYNA